jgi:putative transcriptional regulator
MSYHAGSFLVARSVLQDANFTQTVVLLLQHDEDGAFGLVVNRPAPTASEVPFPVFSGGPCPSEGVILLHGHPEWLDEDAETDEREVAPGVYLGNAELFERLSEGPPDHFTRYRVFAYYSGWGPDQLEGELVAGAWAVVPATGDLLFETPFEELWERLLPPRFPEPSLN